MTFQNYLVKDGQAVPESDNAITLKGYPDKVIPGRKEREAFKTWKQSHTYATDAKDGKWAVERFDIVWQFKVVLSDEWSSENENAYKQFKTYESYVIHAKSMQYDEEINTRQFAKFKEEVEKPKESETIVLDINDFAISLEDVELAFAYGYLANPENNCLDNAEMMRRYKIFKTDYLTPMLVRKHIID